MFVLLLLYIPPLEGFYSSMGIIIFYILLSISFITLAERKLMGIIHRRVGPNIIGYKGILQPIADGIKLILKENISLSLFPIIILIMALYIWNLIPYNYYNLIINDSTYSILIIFIFSSINLFIILYSGWFTSNIYSYLSSIRSITQLISYEINITILLLILFIYSNSLSIGIIYYWGYISYIFFPIFLLFLFTFLAETNRPPFDLAEAESELIAGYLVEYSSITFTALYLSEYSYILLMSYLSYILFLHSKLVILFILFFFFWVRASIPRIRFDSIINLGWLHILPISLSLFYIYISLFFLFIFI